MNEKEKISMSVIRRLPRYYRYLGELESKGITRVSSKEISEKLGLTASQIRQDFNCFGGFGLQGFGYDVLLLHDTIGKILKIPQRKKCILIGVGNLGRALLSISFEKRGFDLIGIFDNNPEVIGSKIKDNEVLPYDTVVNFCKEHEPIMAVICTPATSVEGITDLLYSCNVKAFWNFSHFDINMKYPEVYVENVHLNDSLMTIGYMIGE